MAIRNSAKAILIQNNSVFLNTCIDRAGETFYELPGGGQNQFETTQQALVRECLEGTGFRVRPIRLAAIGEEIYKDEILRTLYLDYSHKLFQIFVVELADEVRREPTELDNDQIDSGWIPIEQVPSLPLRPTCVREHFLEILNSDAPIYFDTTYV